MNERFHTICKWISNKRLAPPFVLLRNEYHHLLYMFKLHFFVLLVYYNQLFLFFFLFQLHSHAGCLSVYLRHSHRLQYYVQFPSICVLVCLFLCASTIFSTVSFFSNSFVHARRLSERVTAEIVTAFAQFTQCKATHIKNSLLIRAISQGNINRNQRKQWEKCSCNTSSSNKNGTQHEPYIHTHIEWWRESAHTD